MRTIERFMFIVPNSRWNGKRCWLWFTPAIPLLVPVVEALGIEVDIVEANIDNLTREQVLERIKAFQPDVVGITNLSLEYWRHPHEAARLVKEIDEKIVTVMGGVQATTLPERVMQDAHVDYAILGEGEERLPQFLRILQSDASDFSDMDGIAYRVEGVVSVNPPTQWIEDLDALSLPDYSRYDWRKVMQFKQAGAAGGLGTRRTPVAAMITSRGCPFNCCFCASHLVAGRKARFRSPEHVLKELDMLVKEYGVREINFQDDEMYADRDRAVAIIQGIKDRQYDLIWKNANVAHWRMDYDLVKLMKESGFYQMTISPESGNERVLKEIIHKPGTKECALFAAKLCREFDIELEADFIIGFPGETRQEIRDTFNFAEELDADSVKFAIATPFPGTEMFEKAVAGGYLPADFDFYRDDALGFAKGVIETAEFTLEDLQRLRCMEWDRINFKTEEKIMRYARVAEMSLAEVEQFRRDTRQNVGIHFVNQDAE